MTDLDSLPLTVTMEEFTRKFTRWKENTSTSPSGRHLGHCKVPFKQPDTELTEDEISDILKFQGDIARAYLGLINYSLKHRYSYNRWKTIVNAMIHKETNNNKIHRLRVIHLYETDLNFMMGLKWKQALHNSEKLNNLHQGQYGSRPGKCPKTIALMEELRLDYSLLTRTSFINFHNDATACFDRIVVSLASLIARAHLSLIHI